MPQTTTHPKPSELFKGTDLGDEYLVYDRQGDQVHVLNGTAREIFLLCDGTRTPEQVVDQFSDRYSEEPSAREDARTVLSQLGQLGVIDGLD